MSRFIPVFLLAIFTLLCYPAWTQNSIWTAVNERNQSPLKRSLTSTPKTFSLNIGSFNSRVASAPNRWLSNKNGVFLELPNADGDFERFEIFRSSVLNSELAAKYPNIQTFTGKSVNDPSLTVHFSYSPFSGLSGFVMGGAKGTCIIETYDSNDITRHRVYNKKETEDIADLFQCLTEDDLNSKERPKNSTQRNADDGYLRQYRLAVSTTGEYSQFFLDGSETNDTERKAKVINAIAIAMTRVNGIFERDFGVTMEIIANNDQVIYLDPGNDPYSIGGYNSQVQSTIDAVIGSSNYDVGHVFVYENRIYGNAGCIACVCTDGGKGSAFTAHNDLVSDHFYMIISHEMGHQFGGWHVQSSDNCRSGFNSEVEPGSGSTIMGYVGICSPNVQSNPDDYFNYVDIRDIGSWTIEDSSCALFIDNGNSPPVVDAGADYIIPASTPFVLLGFGSDPDIGDALTYCWEQNDPENPGSANTPSPFWTVGPLFRSLQPTNSSHRYMPGLPDIINGNLTPTWEVLPAVSRTMEFALTVRDNNPVGGQSASDLMTVTVDDRGGPFKVNTPNTNEIWISGTTVSFSWDVAGTDQTPFNTSTVSVFLSLDGGFTYPITLLNATPNDGSESFILPNISDTNTARLMVKADNNIFLAVNPTNFNIISSDFALNFTDNSERICKPNDALYSFEYKTFSTFSDTVTFSATDLPVGASISFNPPAISGSVTGGQIVDVTISNTGTVPLGSYSIIIEGDSPAQNRKGDINLQIYLGIPQIAAPIYPTNTDTGVALETVFNWQSNPNDLEYQIDIATDNAFTDIVDTDTIETTSFVSSVLIANSRYYYRLKSKNPCGESTFSPSISFTTQCSDPQTFEATAIRPFSVDLQWIDGISSSWEIEYGPSGFSPGTGNIATVATNPATISSLSGSTTYDFYLRSLCSTGVKGIDIGPLELTTAKDYCGGDHFYDSGGATGNYSNNENIIETLAPDNPDERVVVNFNSFQLESCCDFLSVYDGPDSTSPFLGSFNGSTSPGTIRSNHPTGSLTFWFTSDSSVTYSGWDATVTCEPQPDCTRPIDISVTNITFDSASIQWTETDTSTSWEIEYGAPGFLPGTGTVMGTSTNPVVLTGLVSNTAYDFYLRSVCSTGTTSDNNGPYYFKTTCLVNAPYTQDFNNSYSTPDCWSQGSDNQDFWHFSSYSSHAGNQGIMNGRTESGGNFAFVDDSSPHELNTTLLSPSIDISTLNRPALSFYLISNNEGYSNVEFSVDVFDGALWNEDVFSSSENVIAWEKISIDLSNLNITAPIQLRFVVDESNGSDFYDDLAIDDIRVDELPDCTRPIDISVTNITFDSASIQWTETDTSTSWEIEYGAPGFLPGTGTVMGTSTNPVVLTGLVSNTAYDFYLRSVCSTGTTSDNNGPYYFKTTCLFNAPYTQDFNNSYSTPDCWSQGSDNQDFWHFSGYSSHAGNQGIMNGRTESGGNFAFVDDSSPHETNTVLLSPLIDVSTLNNPGLTFYTISNNEGYSNVDFEVDVFDGTAWTENVYSSSDNTNGWQKVYVDLSNLNIAQPMQIRFVVDENNNNDYFDDLAIDDVSVQEFATCPTLDLLSIEDISINSARISWNNLSYPGVLFEVEYGIQGFNLGSGVKVNANVSSLNISGLSSNTNYDVYVRTVCNTDAYTNWVGESFTTSQSFCEGGRFYDSGGPTGNYSNNESYIKVIEPDIYGEAVEVIFNSFELEGCCDYLYIYDGPNTSSPLIGVYNGINNPGTVVSTHSSGALAFQFYSDGSVVYSGWDATVVCTPANSDANLRVLVTNETCRSGENGSITITPENNAISYNAALIGPGTNLSRTFTGEFIFENLSDGFYELYLTINSDSSFLQYYNLKVSQPEPLSVTTKKDVSSQMLSLNLSGAEKYTVLLNGKTYTTREATIELPLQWGYNQYVVKTDLDCQGDFNESFYLSPDVRLFPNPTSDGNFKILLPDLNLKAAQVAIYHLNGQEVYRDTNKVEGGSLSLSIPYLPSGVYLVKMFSREGIKAHFKLLKD